MKFFAATIALVAAAVVNAYEDQPAQSIWADCAPGSDFNITNMIIDPTPICTGENACVTMIGTLLAPITVPSTLTFIATYFGTTWYRQSLDLCSLVSCPVAQNTTTLEFCFPILPTAGPGVWLDFTFSSTNGDGNTLFCQKTVTDTVLKFAN
ncbi:hypothetical protein BGX21_006714, partial [Mortierella sp. AD011]